MGKVAAAQSFLLHTPSMALLLASFPTDALFKGIGREKPFSERNDRRWKLLVPCGFPSNLWHAGPSCDAAGENSRLHGACHPPNCSRASRLSAPLCFAPQEVEGDWFQNFVVGSASQYAAYLTLMRQPKVWGDDPQVQAMCEMYNRPAEIWVYDPTMGARKIKTFHHQSSATPIR